MGVGVSLIYQCFSRHMLETALRDPLPITSRLRSFAFLHRDFVSGRRVTALRDSTCAADDRQVQFLSISPRRSMNNWRALEKLDSASMLQEEIQKTMKLVNSAKLERTELELLGVSE